MKKSGESVEESVLLIKVVSETTNSNLDWMGEVHAGREGGGGNFIPCWFSLNNSETLKASTLEFCSI